jgi:multidrug efflux pump subunit AcrA (membrane-fusion protein)
MNELETKASPADAKTRKNKRLPKSIPFLIGAICLLGLGYGVWQLISGAKTQQTASAGESKVVPVVKVGREDLQTDVTLQAEFVPYQDIMVHAKVSGYVNMIRVDIGDRVKQGDLLATLEIPELQDNLNKAKASLSATEQEIAKAQADYENLHLIYHHGDANGIVNVPLELAASIPEVAEKLRARELDVARFCQSEEFSMDELGKIVQNGRFHR